MNREFQKAEEIFMPANDVKNLEDFISNNFQMPNNDLERIFGFIKKDGELEKIIYELPKLIQDEITYSTLEIRFYDEFQADELLLEVTAYASLDIEKILEKENELLNKLYESFAEKSADKILIFIDSKN